MRIYCFIVVKIYKLFHRSNDDINQDYVNDNQDVNYDDVHHDVNFEDFDEEREINYDNMATTILLS